MAKSKSSKQKTKKVVKHKSFRLKNPETIFGYYTLDNLSVCEIEDNKRC